MTDAGDEDEIEIDVTRAGDERRRSDVDRDPSRRPDRDPSRRTDVDRARPRRFDADDAPESRLEDELGRISLATTPEGYVEGRVTGLESVDETTVRLEVVLPHDEAASFTLEKPIPWSPEFLLARIVEDVGYDAASIGHLVGEPVYVARTDVGEEADADGDRWADSLRTASDALVSSLLGDRYRIEADRSPEWRLVDPLERPDATDDDSAGGLETAAAALVVLGAVVAAAGAAFGASGGLAVSGAVVAAALPGLVLVVIGLAVLVDGRK